MDEARVGRDDGVEEDGEVGARRGVEVAGGGHRGEVPARRHAHDADLGDAPFFCMVAAIAECVLHVCEGDFAVARGHAVADDADGVAARGEGLGGVGAFAAEHEFVVAAAGADQDHLAGGGRFCGLRLTREINDDPGAVTDGVEAPVARPVELGGIRPVRRPGPQGDLHGLDGHFFVLCSGTQGDLHGSGAFFLILHPASLFASLADKILIVNTLFGLHYPSVGPLPLGVKVNHQVRPETVGILRHDRVGYARDHCQGRQQTDQAQKESFIETNHITNIAKNLDPVPEPSEKPGIRSFPERHRV